MSSLGCRPCGTFSDARVNPRVACWAGVGAGKIGIAREMRGPVHSAASIPSAASMPCTLVSTTQPLARSLLCSPNLCAKRYLLSLFLP